MPVISSLITSPFELVYSKRNFEIANGATWTSDVYNIDGWKSVIIVVVADGDLTVRSYQGPVGASSVSDMAEYFEWSYTGGLKTDNTCVDEVVLPVGMAYLANSSGATVTVESIYVYVKSS